MLYYKAKEIGVKKINIKILDYIYPQICGICGKINEESLCNKCKIKLEKEYEFKTEDYKEDVSKNFTEHNYFFKYDKSIRNLILGIKFKERPYYYKTISTFLKKKQKSFEKLKKYDIIIVVPVSRQRKKERGYNQCDKIAKEISSLINVPIQKNILKKIKNIVPQSTLNKQQREENIKGVYKVQNIEKIQNKKILLIDDIYTTGNTINECAKVLIDKGLDKKNIGVLTIAKD